MEIEKLRIIVDEREKKSGIPKLLAAIGVKTEIKTLVIGDYIVAPETVVERKTIADLLSSIFDGRLFDQCSRLTEHYQHPILLVEGNVDEIEELTDNPLIFYGALSTVALALENKIELITDDFAVTNVARQLKIQTLSLTTQGISTVGKWIIYCSMCGKEFSKEKECPICGSKLNRKLIKKSI